MVKLYLLSLLLLAVSNGQIIQNWGSTLSISANTTTYYFPLAGVLTIQSDVPATFTLSLYSSLQVTIPSNAIKPFTFQSVAVGFNFSVNPSTAKVSANFTTPALSDSSLLLLNGGFKAGCLQFDSATSLYNQVDIQSINVLTGVIQFTFPSAGVYVFVGIRDDAYVPVLYGTTHNVLNNTIRRFQYPDGFQVSLGTVNQNAITINKTSTNPYSQSTNGKNIGFYWIITTDTEVNINGTLTYVYNRTDIAEKGLRESTLHFEFYDETSMSWGTENGGSLNQAGLTVTQNTGHFSTWTIADENAAVRGIQVSALLLVALIAVLKFL